MPRLNSTLDDISHVAGYTATRIIAAWWAGRCLYIPSRVRPGHPLDVLAGRLAFQRLVRAYPEQYIHVPSLLEDQREVRDRQIADALARGDSDTSVAATHGLTARRIAQIRQALTESGLLDYSRLALDEGGDAKTGADPGASHANRI